MASLLFCPYHFENRDPLKGDGNRIPHTNGHLSAPVHFENRDPLKGDGNVGGGSYLDVCITALKTETRLKGMETFRDPGQDPQPPYLRSGHELGQEERG